MGSILLDTGVVIAALERRDSHNRSATRAISESLERGFDLKISAVTLAELMSTRQSDRASRVELAKGFIAALGPDVVVPLDRDTAELAGELRSRRRALGLADALIKATADSIGAESLLTTDRALARMDGTTYVGRDRN